MGGSPRLHPAGRIQTGPDDTRVIAVYKPQTFSKHYKRMNLLKTRKGSSRDLIPLIKFIGPLLVAVFFGGAFFYEFTDVLTDISVLQPYLYFLEPMRDAIGVFDYFTPILFLALLSGSVYLASRIDANPVFLPFSIFLGLFSIYISTQFMNLWIEMAEAPMISQYTQKFPLTEAMLLHFNKFIAVAWILIVSVMYKRNRGQRGGAANPIRR